MSIPDSPPPTSPTSAPSRAQLKAAAQADASAVKVKWKTLVGAAKALWTQVPAEDLAKTDGDFHRLAGLVQLRCGISRAESDQQVKAFLAQHLDVAA